MNFSSAFSSAFLRRKTPFALAFSAAFRWRPLGYIGPLSAQAALMGGAGWRLYGSGLAVDDLLLIGPAGKVYAFASKSTATRWAENAAGAGPREAQILASLTPERAAARSSSEAVRAALIAESDYCLGKWHEG